MRANNLGQLFIVLSLLSGCLPLKTVNRRPPENSLRRLLKRNPVNWSVKDCDVIIASYSASNRSGNPHFSDHTADDVLISAIPLNKAVLTARTRKEAINRRLSSTQYKERLKANLEMYTNWNVNLENGDVFRKTATQDTLLNEVTFLVMFENVSDPPRNIEIFRAEEGFFLEDRGGAFSRALYVAGSDVDDYFTLISDLNLEITFSLTADAGKQFDYDRASYKDYRLVFNGLQTAPIVIDWR